MTQPRNQHSWAKPIESFHVEEVARGAFTGNVEGRRPTGPLQGFGRLWQKHYRVEIPGTTPEKIISTWKENFGDFWPPDNEFYAPAAGIAPGEVALIGGGRGPARITTAVRVIYADERSWAYITPEGHPWSAFITFSADEDASGTTFATIDILLRAADPLYEVAFVLYTSRLEDKMWTHTLGQVAGHFGSDAPVLMEHRLVDKKRQWSQVGNIWKNSAIRTMLRRDRSG